MKCDKCKYERCVSNECCTEYYCEIFGDDVPEEFATYDEAKKFCEFMNESMGKYYDSMYTYYGIYEEELSKEHQV